MLERATGRTEVVEQALHFVAQHAQGLFKPVLKDLSPVLSPDTLEELSLAVGVLRLLATLADPATVRAALGPHHDRLCSLVVALCGKFSDRGAWITRTLVRFCFCL
jgi:hypothetical protein